MATCKYACDCSLCPIKKLGVTCRCQMCEGTVTRWVNFCCKNHDDEKFEGNKLDEQILIINRFTRSIIHNNTFLSFNFTLIFVNDLRSR